MHNHVMDLTYKMYLFLPYLSTEPTLQMQKRMLHPSLMMQKGKTFYYQNVSEKCFCTASGSSQG